MFGFEDELIRERGAALDALLRLHIEIVKGNLDAEKSKAYISEYIAKHGTADSKFYTSPQGDFKFQKQCSVCFQSEWPEKFHHAGHCLLAAACACIGVEIPKIKPYVEVERTPEEKAAIMKAFSVKIPWTRDDREKEIKKEFGIPNDLSPGIGSDVGGDM